MSEMERNQGRLIPLNMTVEEYMDAADFKDKDEFFDYIADRDIMVIDNEVYSVEFKVKSDKEMNFATVKESKSGDIFFHTLHYNGGGSLEEVIEDALKQKEKENIARILR